MIWSCYSEDFEDEAWKVLEVGGAELARCNLCELQVVV